jgi:hypothetical protein
MEGSQLFQYLEREERKLHEQAQPAELRSMLDDLKETLQGQFSSAEEYVEFQNKHGLEAYERQRYCAPYGCQRGPNKEDNMEEEEGEEEAADVVDHAPGASTSAKKLQTGRGTSVKLKNLLPFLGCCVQFSF